VRAARSAAVSGAFHSPLVARAAERLRPAIERAHFREPRVEFMSTVTARLEDAQRYRELLVEQLTAPVRFTQAATRARRARRDDVRRGRARQRALRFTEEDRQVGAHDLGQRPEVARRSHGRTWQVAHRSPRSTASSRSSPAPRAGSAARSRSELAGRRGGRDRLPPGKDEAEALAAEIGGRAVQADVSSPGGREAARRGGRRRRRARQQRRPDARRPAGAHVGRRLAHRDRDESQLGLLHVPRRDAADDEEAQRRRSSTSARSSASTATGARRTTPPRRPGSSASRSRSRASSARGTSARTSSRPATCRRSSPTCCPRRRPRR
jgi:acyl transferase domain-containing protein